MSVIKTSRIIPTKENYAKKLRMRNAQHDTAFIEALYRDASGIPEVGLPFGFLMLAYNMYRSACMRKTDPYENSAIKCYLIFSSYTDERLTTNIALNL